MRNALLLLIACVSLGSCRGSFAGDDATGTDTSSTGEGDCPPGTQGCPCIDGQCLGDLVCLPDLDVCAEPSETGSDGGASTGTGGGSSNATSSSDATGTTGAGSSDTGKPECWHRVFVTSSTFFVASDFANLEGADELCQAEADTVMLQSTFKAVLSGPVPAIQRLTLCGPVYLADDQEGVPDDTLVASEAAWWSDTHEAAIQRTASGFLVADDTEVWTGTTAEGLLHQNNCTNWGNGEDFGAIGRAAELDERWIAASNESCNDGRAFYCLEQF